MNGNELLKRLKQLAKERGLALRQVSHRGKGSHITVYLGEKRAVLKDRKKEIGPGLLNEILTQLGIDKSDIG